MERIIIHSDLNNFYASVERKLHPELRGKPIAVCGSKEERRGIVLAKSEEAKRFGVKTGDTIWQAQKKCKDIICVPPHFDEYMKHSRAVKAIYARYTDLIESYGIDECWLDLTKSTRIFPEYTPKYVEVNGEKYFSDKYLQFLGDTIREEVKREIGVTVSCGVSFNKVFAKLGSDLKKPDGTSVISKLNYKSVINGLPVEDLLYVGKATREKLRGMGLNTIGKLAAADEEYIVKTFGKVGETLLRYARGEDSDEVKHMDEKREYKSIGNSCTYPEDIIDLTRIERLLYVLSESVAARLRETDQGLADTVHLWVRDSNLNDFSVQKKVRHTALCSEIAKHAFDLFKSNISAPFSVRALGVTVSGFDNGTSQLTLDETCGNYKKLEKVERCVDEIRKKYGYDKLQRGVVAEEPSQMRNDIKNSHLIKPANFEDRAKQNEKDDN
ncbi:MAG: DNA polymerase IV [Clostridia bacterium]|nr:DNA polymerase IV [Clostridia bacterium]